MKRKTRQGLPLIIRWARVCFRSPTQFSGIAAACLFPALLVGCSFSLNASSGASGSQTPVAAGGGVPAGQVIPVPTLTQPLTACENPNAGISTGDWGIGSNPVFVDPSNVIAGTPVYTSNTIFWTSRETTPGQSILLAGAFTDVTKNVRIAPIPPGTADWQTLVTHSTTVISPTQQGTTGLSFRVPASFPAGVYGFQIEESSAPPVLGLANVPALNWAIGVPSTTDTATALNHQVYDCGAEPGGILRVFGKNFIPSNQVILQSSSGLAYALTPIHLDSNSIAATVPISLAPGTYTVWVGTFPWSATSSPAAQIILKTPQSMNVRNVACSILVGDGVTDNTKRLQSCLDQYAPTSGSNELAYITLPGGGPFVLTGGITPHPFEFLAGPYSAPTRFLGQPISSPPAAWFTIPQHFGMANLSLQAPANPSLLLSTGSTSGNPSTSGHLFFDNVNFASTIGPSNGGESMFLVAGPDIRVYNSTFLSNSNQDFDLRFGDGAIISGNQLVLNNWTGLEIGDSQNVIFENNLTESSQATGQGASGTSGGSGLSISRGNGLWAPSAVSRDVYVGYNTFQNMGSQSQQVVLNDGDGGAYYGPIASSTENTTTLAADPWWAWMGTSNPQAASMSIVSGTGVGQYSFLQSYSGRIIKLATPWKVQPDGTSVVAITQYELYMTWAHNTMTNTLGASFVLGDALESVVEDNNLTNSGAGIYLSAFGPYGGPASYGPVINTDVLRNRLAVGDGNDIWYNPHSNYSGIGIQDMPGCLFSGLMIRDNVVPSRNTIFSTNGVNGINAAVIEQNQAYLDFMFPVPGFLIQDNSPPPD